MTLNFSKNWYFKILKKMYVTDQYLLNMHCKFGGGTINTLGATGCFLVYVANVHIVEFGSLHNISYLL
jgi:hypothetical protein